jgi:TRAP-type C4-dicarboxylate transport system permease small subunit
VRRRLALIVTVCALYLIAALCWLGIDPAARIELEDQSLLSARSSCT